jgi:predicted outer membrane repeat protein
MQRRRLLLVLLIVSAFVALFSGATLFAQSPTLIYVDADAIGSSDGSSWEDAYNDLQTALSVAASGDEIWVAEGVYYPDEGVGQVDDAVTSTFVLTDGVAIYGGFDPDHGVETMVERDWETYVTVLSGDIDHETHPDTSDPHGVVTDTAGIAGNNAYHVVYSENVTATARLDGVTITGGRVLAGNPESYGGGMFNRADGSPTLANVTFSGNAAAYGGGMANVENAPTLINVTFAGNTAFHEGGGMYNDRSHPTLTGVAFSGNAASATGGEGGGMVNVQSTLALTDVAFSNNRARRIGGGMVNKSSNVTLMTATFSNNQAGETGWMGDGGGMYNLDSTLTLADVVFSGNQTFLNGDGGAIDNGSSHLSVTNATFSDNAAGDGGGIRHHYPSSPGDSSSLDLTNVTFSGNSAAEFGGGLASQADVTLTDVTFSDNSADVGGGMSSGVAGISTTHTSLTNVVFVDNTANDRGGGLYHFNGDNSTFITLTHVTFSTNSAHLGGGMAASSRGLPILRNVAFTGNTAGEGGGGMYNKSYSNPRLFSALFSGNTAGDYGGGIYNQSSSTMLMNVTMSGNTATNLGGGIYNDNGGGNLTNTILWNNTTNSGNQIDNSNSTTSIGYSNVQGCGGSSGWVTSCGTDAGGNIDLNPRFVRDPDPGADGQWNGVDDDYGDLYLQSGSPAIDTGTNATFHYVCPSTDLDGNPRPVNGICDMGAYEYDPSPRLDINYDTGAPGSFFTLSGRNFPTNATAGISVNGASLGTILTDQSGGLSFLLSTQEAEEGVYFVKAAVNPSATVRFTLSAGKPIRAQQGSGTIFDIPAGSAYTAFVYLPSVIRE